MQILRTSIELSEQTKKMQIFILHLSYFWYTNFNIDFDSLVYNVKNENLVNIFENVHNKLILIVSYTTLF